ncbi:MAG: hypothetical protein ACTSQB_06730, partial [Candidatus Heimdallarchaeota archaeon]
NYIIKVSKFQYLKFGKRLKIGYNKEDIQNAEIDRRKDKDMECPREENSSSNAWQVFQRRIRRSISFKQE